jgi:hypothetical protein
MILIFKLQINAWSEYNSIHKNNKNKNDNELSEWFIKNKIVEHLFGPNLHVEVNGLKI